MELHEAQQQVDDFIRGHGGYWNKFQILARLTEELGEVSAAIQRAEGLRASVDPGQVNVADEIGDLLFTVAVLANVCGVSLDEALRGVLLKYATRDRA